MASSVIHSLTAKPGILKFASDYKQPGTLLGADLAH